MSRVSERGSCLAAVMVTDAAADPELAYHTARESDVADPAVWKRIHDGLADASRGMSANPATQARSSIREYHSYARATWYCRSRFTGERDPWVG